MNETQTEKRVTAADIKKQIEEAQKAEKQKKIQTDLKDSGLPLNGQVANEINATESTTQNPRTESKSEPAQAPAQPATEKAAAPLKESVELQEWKKKKGIAWDTPDSTALELLRLDQEFHRKQAERKKMKEERPMERTAIPPQWTPSSPYQPAYPPANPYPPYGAPDPKQMAEELARQYEFAPEDVRRLAKFNRDQFEAMMAAERQRHAQELDAIKRENVKNSEFRELAADPVFRKPEVAMEFHNVLEKMQESDPDSFSQDPRAYRKAYDQALINYARRNLEGSLPNTVQEFQLPTNPPKPLGQGAGGGRDTNENGMTQAEFNALPVEEKRKVLDRMGLVQSKY